ncbi:MAG TPA: antibiotic biosynthesis monooxygenase family protein [Flavobacteriaceae bacterium]|nr:antibiotic biosynthesis monooxygenase family protein [Flavobacteriaceae bacterium]
MTSIWKHETPPKAPFYAVIFISIRSENLEGYAETDNRMMELARQQPGYLGYSSADGIFISYWEDLEAIQAWKNNQEHGQAKANASKWYAYYHSMVTRVESSRIFDPHLQISR